MLPVLTGVRIEIDGSTISLLATDRFRLSHRELALGARARTDESLAALVPARVLGDTAKSLTAGSEVTIALAATGCRRGHHRVRGHRPPAAYAAPPPGCSTASSPRSAACSPREHLTVAQVDKAALIESVKRVSLVAERNTAVQLAFSDGVLTLDAGSGDEAQASESIEATDRRRGHHHRLQPAVPARRADRDRRGGRRAGVHPGVQAGGDHRRRSTTRRDGADSGFRYLLMPRRLLS